MNRFRSLVLILVFALIAPALALGETITVGGAIVPIPKGWTQSRQDNGIVLSAPDLPPGVVCTFTLLGGEVFHGSLADRVAGEWKEFERLGRMHNDDGGKITGAGGPVVTAGRSGQIEMKNGVNLTIWMLIVSANGRIERMVFVTSTPEAFTKYGPAVAEMVNAVKYVAPRAAEPAKLASKDPETFGRMIYTIPVGWGAAQAGREVILSPVDPPRGELLEMVLMPAKEFTGTLAEALESSWDEAAELSGLARTRSANGAAYTSQPQRTSFKGWDYIRADGIMTSAPGANDYSCNFIVIKVNGRIERILIRSKQKMQNVRRYHPYQSLDYQRATHEFIFALGFNDWKEPKVEPGTLKGDGIVGVWNGGWAFAFNLQPAYAIFFSNGQVFFSGRFPFRGCCEFNTWMDSEEVPQYWGTYQFKDGKGSLKVGTREIPIKEDGKGLMFTAPNAEHRFVRLASVDGAKFEGTYAFDGINGKVPTIRFTADGRFEDRGALEVMKLDTPYPFSVTAEPGDGTYTVKDHTLLLAYKDGRKHRVAFPGAWGYDRNNPSPAKLQMGHRDLELKKQ